MNNVSILPEKFIETIQHEGVVSVVSWAEGEAHVANTWNTFLVITEDERILIPASGFRKTQRNVEKNNRVKLTLGTREVTGYKDYPGTGFLIDGTARYLTSGEDYEKMKAKFPFLSRVLEIKVSNIKQTL